MNRVVPIIELLRIVSADPELYRRFRDDPASVFVEFGIDRPEYFLGPREVQCPVMPPIPLVGDAATTIDHAYWHTWLRGGALQIEKLGVVGNLLTRSPPLPQRSTLTEQEWERLVAQVKENIRLATAAMRAPD